MKSYHQFPNYPLFCFLPLVRMFEWFDDNVPRLRQTSAPIMERKKLILVQEERNNSHLKEIFDFKFVPDKWCHDWMITGNVRSKFLIHLKYFKRFHSRENVRETGNGKRVLERQRRDLFFTEWPVRISGRQRGVNMKLITIVRSEEVRRNLIFQILSMKTVLN